MLELESLANELFLDIFEFLNTTNLIQAFLNLNFRLNSLLYNHFQNQQFNLQSINKEYLNIICQEQYLSILINHITSIHLSNDNETPDLCEIFLLNCFNFDRFIYLKSLSLYHINTFDTTNEIISQCHNLSYLQKIYLIDCQINKEKKTIPDIINNIWSLSKLVHCIINNLIVNITWIRKILVISSTMEYLSIKIIEGDKSILYYLLKSVPYLKRLNINIIHWSIHRQPKIIFSSLISLKTSFQGQIQSTINFLKELPNLYYLTLEISNICMNGNDWEKFLLDYLPKIKIFRLKMNFNLLTNENIYEQIDRLVDTFRTIFWVEQHQWYIRCDCYSIKNNKQGVLYTLPYAFDEFSYLNTDCSISTKPEDNEFYSHKHVQFINQENLNINSFEDLKLFTIRFPNIQDLEIRLPFIVDIDLYNLSLNQFTSLTIKLDDVLDYYQLQILINCMHQLYSLKLTSFGRSPEGLFQLTSSSIRRLDIMIAQLRLEYFFNHENCIHLINSSFGRQCEVLLIELENQTDILNLIEKMPHLRVLIFRLKDHILINQKKFQSKQKKFMRWLRRNISLQSSIVIDSDSIRRSKICIWIYRKTVPSLSKNGNTWTSNNRLLSHFHTSIRRFFCL